MTFLFWGCVPTNKTTQTNRRGSTALGAEEGEGWWGVESAMMGVLVEIELTASNSCSSVGKLSGALRQSMGPWGITATVDLYYR